MKKILAWALVLLMVVGLFAGCTNEPKPTDPTVVDPTDPVVEDNSANLASALEYLETMYKTVSEITGKDFTRPSSIPFGLDRYDITWTTNTDEVKVVDNGDGTVTIDVTFNNSFYFVDYYIVDNTLDFVTCSDNIISTDNITAFVNNANFFVCFEVS